MKFSNSAMTLVMLVIFVGLVWIAGSYPAGARFMPYVVGIPAIGLCLLQFALDARRRPRIDGGASGGATPEATPADVLDAEMPPRETLRREAAMWAYFLSFIGAILLFGFWVTVPVFLVAFLRFQAKASWQVALLLGLSATAILYFTLEQAFRVELHRGFVTEFLRDQIETRS